MSKKEKIELRVLINGKKVSGSYPIIWLGRGKTIVSDVNGDDWAGIVVSNTEEPAAIGEVYTGDLDPLIVIASKDPRSLDVIIERCQVAKKALEAAIK